MAARQALAMEPTEPYAHLALGTALLDQGNKAGAIAEFEEELRLHPDIREQAGFERARLEQSALRAKVSKVDSGGPGQSSGGGAGDLQVLRFRAQNTSGASAEAKADIVNKPTSPG